jgi:Ca2+-transporting ATPase
MRRRPRTRDQPILGPHLRNRCWLVGLSMAAGATCLFMWQYDEIRADPSFALRKAQTMAVTTVVMFQVFYLFQCRSLRRSVWHISWFSNQKIYAGVLGTVAMQLFFVHSSLMNALFHGAPLKLHEWLFSVSVALAVLPIVSLHKRTAAKHLAAELAAWPEEH